MNKKILILFLIAGIIISLSQAQVIITSDSSLVDSSAFLEMKSHEYGWLIPRMTNQQRDSIDNPAEGLMIYNLDSKSIEYFNGSWVNVNASAYKNAACGTFTVTWDGITYGTVPYKGRCWLDRNLGASKVADSIADTLSYGYYYQWGRASDGHQQKDSDTTWIIADSCNPGHGDFIITHSNPPYDWLSPQNPTLWDDSSSYLNNPCPSGWKVPYLSDWCNTTRNWVTVYDALDSPLKLPAPGIRNRGNGDLIGLGTLGMYWTNQSYRTMAAVMRLDRSYLTPANQPRSDGESVRCIRQEDEIDPTYSILYGSLNADRPRNLIMEPDGDIVMVGFTYGFDAQSHDYMMIKVDQAGALKWGEIYGYQYNDTANGVKTTVDGGYVINGTARWGTTYHNQMYIIKTDSTGNIEWDYSCGSTGDESGYDVILEADSCFVFVGSTTSFGFGGADVYFRKFDTDGNPILSYAYGTTYDDFGYAMIKDTDDGYAIIGDLCCDGPLGGREMEFIKINPVTYTFYSYSLGGAEEDGGNDLVLAHDSGYVLAGYTCSYGAGNSDFYIRKLDKNLSAVWSYTYGGASNDVAKSIIRTPDNGFAVLGNTNSFGEGQSDMWLLKIDSEGQFEWSFAFGFIGNEYGQALVQDENGYFYATGNIEYTSNLGGQPDFLLVKFTPDGKACIGEYIDLAGERKLTGDEFHAHSLPKQKVIVTKVSDDIIPLKMQVQKLKNDYAPGNINVRSVIYPEVNTICE